MNTSSFFANGYLLYGEKNTAFSATSVEVAVQIAMLGLGWKFYLLLTGLLVKFHFFSSNSE